MRWLKSGILLIVVSVAMSDLYVAEYKAVTSVNPDSYAELKPQQQRLFNDLVQRYSKVVGKKIDPKKAYETSPVSVRTTFNGVTHALLISKLSDSEGKSLGTTLDLVDSLETIRGKVNGVGGDKQFRVYVILRRDAYETLQKSVQFKRTRNNTIYHKGYPISFRQQGGTPSLQVSMSRDKKRGDIDVDYRSSGFPKALFNGHLTSANSDVRTGKNYRTHVGRWSGLNNWWMGLFDLDSLPTLEETAGLSKGQKIPDIPRVGKTKIHNAVSDFLNALLVEGAANEAAAYISNRAYSCWELKGETAGQPLNRSLAPYILMEDYKEIHKSITKVLGKTRNLKQVIRGVRSPRIEGRPGLRFVKHPFSNEFALYNVREGNAVEWSCSARLTGDTPKKRESNKYGKYYLAVFRVPPKKGEGVTVDILLTKERGYWKIISFDDEADVDYSSVPDLRAQDQKGKALKIVGADERLVSEIGNFHRSWFLRRNYPEASQYFSPAIFSCRNLYLEPGIKPAENLNKMIEGWRKGMQKISEELGIHKELSSVINSVNPSTNDLAIVKHRDQRAFTIFALPDQLGAAVTCSNRENIIAEKIEGLQKLPAGGNYYAASFTANAAGGGAAVLTTNWQRTDKGWRIYSYRVDTP